MDKYVLRIEKYIDLETDDEMKTQMPKENWKRSLEF